MISRTTMRESVKVSTNAASAARARRFRTTSGEGAAGCSPDASPGAGVVLSSSRVTLTAWKVPSFGRYGCRQYAPRWLRQPGGGPAVGTPTAVNDLDAEVISAAAT